jgi:hypothetical protein
MAVSGELPCRSVPSGQTPAGRASSLLSIRNIPPGAITRCSALAPEPGTARSGKTTQPWRASRAGWRAVRRSPRAPRRQFRASCETRNRSREPTTTLGQRGSPPRQRRVDLPTGLTRSRCLTSRASRGTRDAFGRLVARRHPALELGGPRRRPVRIAWSTTPLVTGARLVSEFGPNAFGEPVEPGSTATSACPSSPGPSAD